MGVLDLPVPSGAQLDAIYTRLTDAQAAGTHAALIGESRVAHGGRIGTRGKGVVAFRIDHCIDAYRTTVWPLMKARGIPGGLGIVSRPNNPVDPFAMSWAQVHQMVNEGNEVWCHSATHSDPTSDIERLVDEIVTSKSELEALGFKVQGWQMPGTPSTNPDYGPHFLSVSQFNSAVGRLLLSNYGLIECYAGGSRRALPTEGCYGLDHVTIDNMSLASLKNVVDEVVNYAYGVEFMLHAKSIGASGCLSVADFATFLDYVKAKWDSEDLEVLSPSGLAWADPHSSRKTELLIDGSFESAIANAAGPVWYMQGGSGVTIGDDGGHTGGRYARFTPASNYAYLIQGNTKVKQLGLNGTTMIAEGWARAPRSSANARMFVLDNNDNSRIKLDVNWPLAAGQSWTRFRIPFVCPVGTTNLAVKVSRYSGDIIDWDDIRMYVI